MGHQEPLLLVVKHQKLAWVELVTCHDNLSKVILHGIVENGLRCGGQRKSCNDHRNNLAGCGSPRQCLLVKRVKCAVLLLVMLPSWYTNDPLSGLRDEWVNGIFIFSVNRTRREIYKVNTTTGADQSPFSPFLLHAVRSIGDQWRSKTFSCSGWPWICYPSLRQREKCCPPTKKGKHRVDSNPTPKGKERVALGGPSPSFFSCVRHWLRLLLANMPQSLFWPPRGFDLIY